MHPSTDRLYIAAHKLKDVNGQSAVARLLNESPQTVKNWETRGVSRSGALRAEEVIGARAAWILTGDGEMAPSDSQLSIPPVAPPADDSPPEGYARLPVMAEASAGPGRSALQEVVQHVDVLETYIRQRLRANPANVKVLTARGTSMSGLIEDGDVMFVQPTNEFTDDGVYILTLDDLIRVKRLSVSITTGKVVIESNDGRAPEELPLKEVPHRLHIQGRVIGSWSLKSFS